MSDCNFFRKLDQMQAEHELSNLPAKREVVLIATGYRQPPQPSQEPDDPVEVAFWEMDARIKGYGQWKGMPQSQRGAFKAVVHGLLAQAAQAVAP